jgi:PTH1 family peptidyl-tRNA hydrolase
MKPLSFMNRSGYPVFAVAQFYKFQPEEILVVADDFSLPLGRLRLRPRGGSGGHNGLESVIVEFGTEEIPRLRIGIGLAPREGSVDYVLNRFFDEEKPLVRLTINRAVEAVKCAIDNGLVSAMNIFNPESPPTAPTTEFREQ